MVLTHILQIMASSELTNSHTLVCDNGTPGPLCDTAVVYITVINPTVNNEQPIANTDEVFGEEGSTITGSLIANDVDPDGDMLTINTTPVTAPDSGTVVINADGTFEYIPNAGFAGTDSFTYVICDDGTPVACDTALVVINVLPITGDNQPPYAGNDANVTSINTDATGNVLPNDGDPNGDNLVIKYNTS